MGCSPTLFRSVTGLKQQQFTGEVSNPISGYEFDPFVTQDVYIAYPINEDETANNLGIHWCWRNTEGTGLGRTSCQSNSLSTQYLSPIYYPHDKFGQLYMVAKFDQIQSDRGNKQWEVAPWAGTEGYGFGSRQCTSTGTTVIKTTTGNTCNNPAVSVAYTGEAIHIGVAVDATRMPTTTNFKALIKKSGLDLGGGWVISLQRQGTQLVGETTVDAGGHMDKGDYVAVIAKEEDCRVMGDNLDITRLCQAYPNCSAGFSVDPTDQAKQIDYEDRGKVIQDAEKKVGSYVTPPFDLCKQIPASSPAHQKCEDCRDGKGAFAGAQKGLWTAVGCVSTNGYEGIVSSLLRVGLGIAGGVALLMIISSAFMLSTSQGEPKRAGEARDLLTSAVMGLLFIIFSVTILQFIGVSLLHIPGFGK